MTPTKVEVPYSQLRVGRLISLLTFEVGRNDTSVTIHIPEEGTIRLTEAMWDELVQKVNEAFVDEPVEEDCCNGLCKTAEARTRAPYR